MWCVRRSAEQNPAVGQITPNATEASLEITAGLSRVVDSLPDPAWLDAIIQADLENASKFGATPESSNVITIFRVL